MIFDFDGDLYICDPKYLMKDVKLSNEDNSRVVSTGIGMCYLTIHPVEEYKEFFANKEEHVKEKINKAYLGYIPRGLGKIGSDTGNIGFFPGELVDKSLLVNGEYFKVKAFKGKIGTFYDTYGMLHFYGTGNYNFFSL